MPAVTAQSRAAGRPRIPDRGATTSDAQTDRDDRAFLPPSPPAWWVHPTWALLFLALPILLLTLSEGPVGLFYYKNLVDNYTPFNCSAAVGSLLALICGTLVCFDFRRPSTLIPSSIDPLRAKLVLGWLGVVSLVAYILLLRPWLLHPEIVWQALQGGGADEAKQAMDRMPGITSFTNVAPLFCAIWAAARLDPLFYATKELKCIFAALLLCTIARAVLGSERLALVEFFAPLVLAQAAFHTRSSLVRATFPALGLLAFVGYFAVTEYFRSWQFYRFEMNDQFWEFSLLRLVGYFSTSLNNGMGMFQLHSPLGMPYFTASAVAKMSDWPLVGGAAGNISDDIWAVYLFEFGNGEFNNLSGLFAPLIDYGITIGLVAMCLIGVVIGLLYRSYTNRRITGLMLYPTFYLGVLEILRLFYFGESRVVPILVAAPFLAWLLRGGQRRQFRLLVGRRRVNWQLGANRIGEPSSR